MKLSTTLFIFLASLLSLLSQELPFKIERMNTDYRGVTTNGKSILCYGDFGLITYTLDYGKTFQQVNIGDKYSIKSINAIGSDFVGVTETSLLKSTTNGETWVNKKIFDTSTIIDASVASKTLFLLTAKGVYVADTNLYMSPEPLLALDSTAEYSEFETDGKDIYIIYNKKSLIHYAMDTKQLDTTNIISTVHASCDDCSNIANLKIFGNTVYLMVNLKYQLRNSLGLVKSDNKGKSWHRLTEYFLLNSSYHVDDSIIYAVRQKNISIANNDLFAVEYLRMDTSHFAIDTSDYTIINDDSNIPDRPIYGSSVEPVTFKEIISINKDTLIAVGVNKMIVMSYNGGKTWETKSFFDIFFRDREYASFPSKDIGYFITSLPRYKTQNGGITWRPQKYNTQPKSESTNLLKNTFYFNSSGKGFVKTITKNVADTNIAATNDYGETYTLLRNDSLTHYRYDNNSSFLPIFQNGLDIGDYILYLIVRSQQDSSSTFTNKYTVLRYDKNFQLVDTAQINTQFVISMVVAKDSSIICLARNTAGTNKTDSTGTSGDYSYSYFLIKSTDKGKTWDSLIIKVPIYPTLQQHYSKAYYLYSHGVYSKCTFLKDNYILFPSFSQKSSEIGYNLLYRYNYVNNIFDSVKIPTKLSDKPNTIFSFGNVVYAVSSSNNLFYSKNIEAPVPVWDSIRSTDIFAKWDGFDSDYPSNGKYAILSAHTFNDTSGFMTIGISSDAPGGKQFKVNVVKLSPQSGITGIDVPIVEEPPRVSLWNYQPYPVPGTNKINCKLYWNKAYNIDDAAINVYSVYGTLIPAHQIQVNKIQNNLGILEWDCSGAPPGVYIVQITLAGDVLSFPVMVMK